MRGVRHTWASALRFFVILFILLASILPVRHAQSAAALERGTAIIDPLALRELDSGRFGLGRVLLPERAANLCFGGAKRNRLLIAASRSIYALYVNAQGATLS